MRLRPIQLTVEATTIGSAVTWSYPYSDGKVYVIPTYAMTVAGQNSAGRSVVRTFEVIRFGVHRTPAHPTPYMVGLSQHHRYTIRRWIPTYKVHSYPSREDGAWQVHGNYLIHDGPDHPMRQLYATAGCIEICGGPNGFVEFNRFLVELSGSTKRTMGEQLREIGDAGCMTITYVAVPPPPVIVR
jgi:hypothetical protein